MTAASATLGTVGTITNFDGGARGFEDKNTAEITYTAPNGTPPHIMARGPRVPAGHR